MPKERKIILVVGALLLILALAYRIDFSWSGWGHESAEIGLKQNKLQRLNRIAANGDQVEKQYLGLKNSLAQAESKLLQADTTALAGVAIQQTLQRIAKKLEVDLKRVHVLKPIVGDNALYAQIPVDVTTLSTIRQLKDLLYQVESAEKMMHVTHLKVRAGNARRSTGLVQSAFTVVGYMSLEIPQKLGNEDHGS